MHSYAWPNWSVNVLKTVSVCATRGLFKTNVRHARLRCKVLLCKTVMLTGLNIKQTDGPTLATTVLFGRNWNGRRELWQKHFETDPQTRIS